jgi:hypothetical protein
MKARTAPLRIRILQQLVAGYSVASDDELFSAIAKDVSTREPPTPLAWVERITS